MKISFVINIDVQLIKDMYLESVNEFVKSGKDEFLKISERHFDESTLSRIKKSIIAENIHDIKNALKNEIDTIVKDQYRIFTTFRNEKSCE